MRALLKTVGRAAPLVLAPTFAFCDDKKATAPGAPTPASKAPSSKLNVPKVDDKLPVEKNLSSEEQEDAEWEEKKKNCSFCRHFLESPCKDQFKGWSKCVEKCKEEDTDFVEICSPYTKALVTCTSLNPEYFKESGEKDDDDEGDEVASEEKQTGLIEEEGTQTTTEDKN